MERVVRQYALRPRQVVPTRCEIATMNLGRMSTSIYRGRNEKVTIVLYNPHVPMSKKSTLTPRIKSPVDIIENKMLASVYPEIVGAAIGGVAMMSASFYLVATGLASAGYALLGPSIAGIFGSVALWILNRKAKEE